jgi:flagellar biosynthesis protein FliR
MLTITTVQLNAWLAGMMWPFIRILGLMIAAPLFGNQRFPVRMRVGLALLITVVVAPTLPPLPDIAPDSPAGLGIFMQQLLIGLAMGFAVRMVFTAVEMAGELIGLQMGLGFAVFYDPQSSGQMPVVGQFLGLVATLTFLALNGHLMMISTLADSFREMPITAAAVDPLAWRTIAGWGSKILYSALLLSLPVVAALLTTNLALGVLTRAAPQLNVFAVGFPITLAVGFGALLLSLPFFTPVFERLLADSFGLMLSFRP